LFVKTSSRTFGSPTDGVGLLLEVIFNHSTLVTAIYVSLGMHFILIITNYIIPGVWKSKDAMSSISMPFARLIVLHISILVLGFILSFFNTDLFILLILFVIFKSLVEAGLSLMSASENKSKTDKELNSKINDD
jgi:hypothetical protein